jgi:spore germination cell wall hydrolase CwlJ-like protein
MTSPVDVLARTLFGEDDTDEATLEAVASVIMNRADHPRWWGDDVISVCTKPYQFSCWLPGPDRIRLLNATPANPVFALATAVAQRAIAGTLADSTRGSDSYYAVTMVVPPAWATPERFRVQISRQRYYRVELPPLPA